MSWTPRPPLRSPFTPPSDAPAPVHHPRDVGAQPRASGAGSGEGGPALSVLTVCTGNICRSAYAHHVLQARLDVELGRGVVEVSSAGTGPNQALAVPAEILGLVPDADVRDALTAHRPQLLTARVLAGQDLVLAATDRHLDAVTRESPAALRRSATLLGAGARLADPSAVTPGGGAQALAAALTRGRAEGRGLGRRAADLPDPFRGPAEGYAAMARALDPALEAIAAAVVRAVRPAG